MNVRERIFGTDNVDVYIGCKYNIILGFVNIARPHIHSS